MVGRSQNRDQDFFVQKAIETTHALTLGDYLKIQLLAKYVVWLLAQAVSDNKNAAASVLSVAFLMVSIIFLNV